MVRIARCLCSAGHCILGFAYTPGETAAQKDFGSREDITLDAANAAGYLQSIVEGLIARRSMDPWCWICRSRIFRYEDALSAFGTVKEAGVALQLEEGRQRIAHEAARN